MDYIQRIMDLIRERQLRENEVIFWGFTSGQTVQETKGDLREDDEDTGVSSK